MNITISIGDLGLFVIFCMVVVLGVYLIVALRNMNRLVKRIDKIVETNEEPLRKAIAILPQTVGNINETASSIKGSVDKAEVTIGAVGSTLTQTVSTVSESTEDVIDYVKIISEVVKTIFQMFSGSKEK